MVVVVLSLRPVNGFYRRWREADCPSLEFSVRHHAHWMEPGDVEEIVAESTGCARGTRFKYYPENSDMIVDSCPVNRGSVSGLKLVLQSLASWDFMEPCPVGGEETFRRVHNMDGVHKVVVQVQVDVVSLSPAALGMTPQPLPSLRAAPPALPIPNLLLAPSSAAAGPMLEPAIYTSPPAADPHATALEHVVEKMEPGGNKTVPAQRKLRRTSNAAEPSKNTKQYITRAIRTNAFLPIRTEGDHVGEFYTMTTAGEFSDYFHTCLEACTGFIIYNMTTDNNHDNFPSKADLKKWTAHALPKKNHDIGRDPNKDLHIPLRRAMGLHWLERTLPYLQNKAPDLAVEFCHVDNKGSLPRNVWVTTDKTWVFYQNVYMWGWTWKDDILRAKPGNDTIPKMLACGYLTLQPGPDIQAESLAAEAVAEDNMATLHRAAMQLEGSPAGGSDVEEGMEMVEPSGRAQSTKRKRNEPSPS